MAHKVRPLSVEEHARALERARVMQLARGNVSLQLGRFVTAEDIRAKKDHYKKYRFAR